MFAIEDIIERYEAFSNQISVQVRLISYGLLGVMWAIVISSEKLIPTEGILTPDMVYINFFSIALVAVLTLTLDFLQNIIGVVHSKKLLSKADAELSEKISINPNDALYKTAHLLFWLKQILLVVNLIIFFKIIICLVLSYR